MGENPSESGFELGFNKEMANNTSSSEIEKDVIVGNDVEGNVGDATMSCLS